MSRHGFSQSAITMKPDNSTAPTHVEFNQRLLNTIFEFNMNSMLKEFLINKTGVDKTFYSLGEVLTILKNTIREEGMFDPSNPAVILCNPSLEKALNMKALHVTEVRDLVLSQMKGNLPQQPSSRIMRIANNPTTVNADESARFTLKPGFLKVLGSAPGADPNKQIFSYEDVTSLLSKYILSRKDNMFDPRNIKLALVADDPLGKAFGVKAFHRCQVNNLLKKQLIPFDPNCPSNPPIVTSSSGPDKSADQCHLNSTTLTTASKLPTNPLNPSEEQRRTRKRNSAGDLTEQAGTELDSESYPSSQLCILCCQRPRDASFIHGDLGHMVSCFHCADRLWKRQATCPVCRRKVDRIIKIIES